jgi:hypothetical protein
MEQAKAACEKRSEPYTVPVVVCREDEGNPMVILHLCDFNDLAAERVRDYYLKEMTS